MDRIDALFNEDHLHAYRGLRRLVGKVSCMSICMRNSLLREYEGSSALDLNGADAR